MHPRLVPIHVIAVLASLALTGCPEPPPDVEPLFPSSYQTDWTMVRDCRRSIEHDLRQSKCDDGK